MVKKAAPLVALSGILLMTQSLCLAQEGDLLSYFTNSKKPIKVFVGEFVNDSGQPQISPEEFKKNFQSALMNRKSVIFQIAKSPEASDVQISGIIKKYLYSKTDPITSYAGAGGLLLDAVTTENYVEMAAEFTVVETKTGKTVWKKDVSAFIKRMMTPEQSIPLIYEKLPRTFLAKSFGKPKR